MGLGLVGLNLVMGLSKTYHLCNIDWPTLIVNTKTYHFSFGWKFLSWSLVQSQIHVTPLNYIPSLVQSQIYMAPPKWILRILDKII